MAITAFDIARDLPALVAAPLGRAVVGSTYVAWCAAPDIVGAILWGELDERDVRDLAASLACIRHPDMAPTVRVVWDCRAVERVSSDVLLGLVGHLGRVLPQLSPRISRQVIVVPDGLAGVLLAGAVPSLAPAHPVQTFRDLTPAWAALGHPTVAIAHHTALGLATAARGPSVLVSRLRAHLANHLEGATIGDCADALGVASRTLQRELLRCATSFSDELRRLRIAAAEELLALSDMKIEAIASRVGYGTASRLSATLNRERSVTASELRACGYFGRAASQRSSSATSSGLDASPARDARTIASPPVTSRPVSTRARPK